MKTYFSYINICKKLHNENENRFKSRFVESELVDRFRVEQDNSIKAKFSLESNFWKWTWCWICHSSNPIDLLTKSKPFSKVGFKWNILALLTFVSAEPFSLIGLVVTLLRGAPWAVTKCFRRYHLFFTTLSHSEQDTPCDWMCTLTICCFKLKELENVFQQ